MVDLKKEQEPVGVGREKISETPPAVETTRISETPLEVESFISKIEKRFTKIPKQGDAQDDVVVVQPGSKQPPIKLPVTNSQIQSGQKSSPTISITWLVAWAVRQIKMMARLGRKVEVKEESGAGT